MAGPPVRSSSATGRWRTMRNWRNALSTIGAGTRDAEGLRDARRLFALALETPGGLKIQTIHSFCQNLLARFPLEAGVPPAFRVLDDATARALRDEARLRVLDRAGRGDAALADATARLVTETSETTFNDILDAAFGSDRRKLERFLARYAEARSRPPSVPPMAPTAMRRPTRSRPNSSPTSSAPRTRSASLSHGCRRARHRTRRLRQALPRPAPRETSRLSPPCSSPARARCASVLPRRDARRRVPISSNGSESLAEAANDGRTAVVPPMRPNLPRRRSPSARRTRRITTPPSGRAACSTMTISS